MKKKPIDISVIVPVYNVEDYLSECVDSLINQHDIHLEILLIDDGSTDRSGVIADQYAQQNSCIQVIHQENGGLSAARNTGLELAQGEYIAFVDSDDWIREGSLKLLYNTASKHQADVMMGNLQYYHQDGSNKNPFNAVPEKLLHTLLSGKEGFSELIKSGAYTPMVWNYIYRLDYIKHLQIRFEEGIIHEDELWTSLVLCQASRMVISDVEFYYYRQRDGSITNVSNSIKRLNSLLCVANRLMEFSIQFNFTDDGAWKNWLYVNIFRVYSNAFSRLSKIKNTSYQLPEHQLARYWRDAWEMTPEPQRICRKFFHHAETGLKKYTDWLTSDWVASIATQIGSRKKLMLIFNTRMGNDLSIIVEDVPLDWIITTDRRYIHQADVVVFHLTDLSNELEEDIEKSEGQIWVAWHLELEKDNPLLNDKELRETFDLWMCYQQEEIKNDRHLIRLCRQIYNNKETHYMIHSSKPLLSVVMPVYNGQLYIEQAIDSVLQQTISDFEFIIIDDVSTDDTISLINSYHDKRIKKYSNKNNLGNYPSRNLGMKNAVGKYIAVMDADDICVKNRFEKQIQFMEVNKEIGITGSAVRFSTGGEMFSSSNTDFLKILFFQENNISHPSLMFRKEMFEKHHLQYDENYRYSADYDLLVRSFRCFDVTCMKEVLLIYRIHSHQISTEHQNSQQNYAHQIRLRQLSHLGVQPTNEEIEIHLHLLQKKQTVKKYAVEDYHRWSEKLISQNNSLQYFQPSLFSDYICRLLNHIRS